MRSHEFHSRAFIHMFMAIAALALIACDDGNALLNLGDADGAGGDASVSPDGTQTNPDGVSRPDAIVAQDMTADAAADGVISDMTATDMGSMDMGMDIPPPDPPTSLDPCQNGDCWSSLSFGGVCGVTTLNENYSSGNYNVHELTLNVRAGVRVELTLTGTGGTWNPALIVHDGSGATVYDGERGVSGTALTTEVVTTGRGGNSASMAILSEQDATFQVFLTGWTVIDGDFTPRLGTDVTYQFTANTDCVPPMGELLSPPNFDENDIVGGYYLLPQSDPSGLYTRKADDCSRGNKLLIDVIYTVALRFNQMHPQLSPIAIRDMNEGSCSTVDHATHNDGTHVDIVAGCATQVSCTDNQPMIDLANLFVETGVVCGILNNETSVQPIVNAYFESLYSYEPWNPSGAANPPFMRSVTGHTTHFHVRVMKPDGTCN